MKKSVIPIILSLSIALYLWQNGTHINDTRTNHETKTRSESTGDSQLIRAREEPKLRPLMWSWKKGSVINYDFLSLSTLNMNPKSKFETKVTGKWHVSVLDDGAKDGIVVLATVFSNVHFTSDTQTSELYGRMLEQVPCLLKMHRNGNVIERNFPDYLKGDDRRVIAGLNPVQLHLGTPNALGEWQSTEIDANGSVDVRYKFFSNGNIGKQRLGYSRLAANGIAPGSSLGIVTSDASATFGNVWFKEFQGSEILEFTFNGKSEWTSSQSWYIKQIGDQSVPDVLASLATAGSIADALKLLEGDLPEVIQEAGSGSISDLVTAATRRAKYANVSFEQALNDFNSIMDAAVNHADRLPAIENFKDWLLARPEEASKIGAYLATPALPEEKSACILNALELASSSISSQAVLKQVLGDVSLSSYPASTLVQAAVAAGGVGEVLDQGLMDNLYRLAFNPDTPGLAAASDCSLLALGNLARTNPALRERLGAELGDTLNETTPGTEGYVAVALMALTNGNIRSNSIENSAKRIFTDASNDKLRAAALTYLHKPEAPEAALTALREDSSTEVRCEAINLLGTEDISYASVEAMTTVLLDNNTSPIVRASAARMLKRHESRYPSISEAFGRILQQSTVEDLNEIILAKEGQGE